MSKMDGLRAMREARYAQAAARSGKPAARPKAMPRAASQPAEAQPADAEPAEALCGHRAISGRTCTREQGHAAKSHRYS
jgi:hypothetical protein